MTPEKAKQLVFDEIDTYVNDFIKSQEKPLTEKDKQELEKKVSEFKNRIIVTGVSQSDKDFTVQAEIIIESRKAEFKINDTDKGLVVDSFKPEGGEKIPMSAFLDGLKSVVDMVGTKGKMLATMRDMKSIGVALESYMTDMFLVPQVENFSELKDILTPFYIKTLPLKDAWGNEFYYAHGIGSQQDIYSVGSAGSDGSFEGFDQTGIYTDLEGKDIIYSNGNFVYLPKTK
jgi:hypothetical protein